LLRIPRREAGRDRLHLLRRGRREARPDRPRHRAAASHRAVLLDAGQRADLGPQGRDVRGLVDAGRSRACYRPRNAGPRSREGGEPRAHRIGLLQHPETDRVSDRARSDRARVLLRAAQPGPRGSGGREAAPGGALPRRADRINRPYVSLRVPVLDQPRLRAGRRELRRFLGLWTRISTNGARYLVERGLVDGDRVSITGGSAGGFTVLLSLTKRDFYNAGASHYGIGDLELFVKETHKFESRYCDWMVGPYPERADVYRERSAIHYADNMKCPVILFQGAEDKIVPPDQAETFVEACRQKHLPYAYVLFEGEQHGFRQDKNIRRAFEGELSFLAQVFGFQPADDIEPVKIENR
ncbi:MAG: hypothetical protein E6I82_08485, partial [Chloroflexi bacterium]